MATEASRLLSTTALSQEEEGPPGFPGSIDASAEPKWSTVPTDVPSFVTCSHPLHDGQPRDTPMQLPAQPQTPRFGHMLRCGAVVGPCRRDASLFLLTLGFTLLVALQLPLGLALHRELFDPAMIHWHLGLVTCATVVLVALGCTSLRDPGVAVISEEMRADAARMTREEFYGKYRWCRRCEQPMANDTTHCNSCSCCIRGLDHHCSFVGKCVGARTKHWFNLFVVMLPVTWLYTTICAWHCGYQTLFMSNMAVLATIVAIALLIGFLLLCQCVSCTWAGARCKCSQNWPICYRALWPCRLCCDSSREPWLAALPGEAC